ncbi:hypothetical protein ElyMa_000127000 [Elysia marginata]|uniref:Uncharacterized protein n=1 Tax=Elysia marginata TaxID=1093978 RepID=A0AAV4EPD4_9GAST|nr:hypothetical protein ElyMa_000127000 [Elysia marginata]
MLLGSLRRLGIHKKMELKLKWSKHHERQQKCLTMPLRNAYLSSKLFAKDDDGTSKNSLWHHNIKTRASDLKSVGWVTK